MSSYDDPGASGTMLMSRVGARSVLGAMLQIAAMKVALGALGFNRTRTLIQRRCENVTVAGGDHDGAVATADRIVSLAAGVFPGRAACLEQSLVLYYVLRRRGIAVKFCVGVVAYPFISHAWVEYGGSPINDTTERVSGFTEIPLQLS